MYALSCYTQYIYIYFNTFKRFIRITMSFVWLNRTTTSLCFQVFLISLFFIYSKRFIFYLKISFLYIIYFAYITHAQIFSWFHTVYVRKSTYRSNPASSIFLWNLKTFFNLDCPWCEIKNTHAGQKYIKTTLPAVKKEKWSEDIFVKGRNEPAAIM